MNISCKNSFTVCQKHCNYQKVDGVPMVHGGDMLKMMDRASAECARRFLYHSESSDSCRTVGVDKVTFLSGAYLGDIVVIKSHVKSVGKKSIKIFVECFLDKQEKDVKMSQGEFTYCSFLDGKPHPHGISL